MVDTCVWLDLAKGVEQSKFLGVLEEIIDFDNIVFVLPRIVLEEFERNKSRVIIDATKSLSSVFGRVRDIINEFGISEEKADAIKQLDNVRHKLPSLAETTAFNISRIEKILSKAIIVDTTSEVLVKAAQRAIDKRAPFHLNKNSMADAAIIEIYGACVEKGIEGEVFVFVTHNKDDFGAIDKRQPHKDLSEFFLLEKSHYSISLVETLRSFFSEEMSDIEAEQGWEEVPRTFTEIVEAENEIRDILWYNFHKNLARKIRSGEVKLIDASEWKVETHNTTCTKEVWKTAKAAARKVEKQYGKAKLGPYDDFEWAMLWGKLSALRWVTGSEWEFLDL